MMNPVSLSDLLGDAREKTVVDVRVERDFAEDTFEGAVNIPLAVFEERKKEIPKEKPVYLLCYNGRRSAHLAEALSQDGYEAYNIDQGYYALVKHRLEIQEEAYGITSGTSTPSTGSGTVEAPAMKTATVAEPVEAPEATDLLARRAAIERSLIKTYRKELWSAFTRAIRTYDLIRDGDKIAVCISGGKDSTLMAKLFQEMLRHGQKNFEAVFLVMNPGYNEINLRVIKDNARLLGIPIEIFDSDIYDIVAGDAGSQYHVSKSGKNKSGSPCYLCARMRRGALYDHAKALGCNKIALGHHYDDVIETILMGMLYGGQIQTMMPKLHSTNFPGMELIRPLYFVREDDIKRWRDYNHLHFIRCACRLTESCDITDDGEPYFTESGAGESTSVPVASVGHKRTEIKQLIAELKKRNPYIESNLFKSVENVHLGAVIAYKDKAGMKHHFLDAYDDEETMGDNKDTK